MTSGLRHSSTEPSSLQIDRFVDTMTKKKSPQPPLKIKNAGTASESDGSVDSSPSIESCKESAQNQKRITRRGSEWEILEGLKEGQRFDKKPDMFSGYLHKKRKWPLKGWYKRFFILDKGVLTYGKGPSEIARGKVHGQVDIGLSVISTKGKRKRIDIDADEFIHHLKAKRYETFLQWVEQLKKHRLYRQHVLTFGNVRHVQGRVVRGSMNKSIKSPSQLLLHGNENIKAHSPPPCLASWVMDSNTPLQCATKELEYVQQRLNKLSCIFDQLENTTADSDACSLSVGLSQYPVGNSLSSSNPALNCILQNRPASLSAPISTTDSQSEIFRTNSDLKIYNDFISLAKDIHQKLRSIINTLSNERDRLKTALESDSSSNGPQAVIANLQNSLVQAVQQNNDLRTRLNNIHANSDISDLSEPVMNSSLSYSSLYVSTTDVFFDAEDFLHANNENDESVVVLPEGRGVPASDTSSEAGSISSEEGSVSSENSDGGVSDYNPRQHDVTEDVVNVKNMTGHREKLPCPRPNTEGLSLWSLLRKNIGVDLSRVSMPVALNEPLSMLQRLCEELEYAELLDKAAETEDPYERMVYVAAFAVSSYGSSYYRAGSKPFNPLLGETYECVREDKGFRFVGEQVSHHPPVTVCHAEGKNFVFWQDLRIKTKFWGKSMEFQPLGHVNLKILRPDHYDYYRWNKVTTCVHNLFSGQRWADLSGELKIVNLDKNITCKLTFVKPNYWSAKRNEVIGTVMDEKGNVVRNLFGKWNEALYCGVPPSAKCIWRPGTMPENHEMYYGFTRFAIELNELDPETAKYLPKTDTRFRPDQRLLEEGDLTSAEAVKSDLEQKQRERRKQMEEANIKYEPKWFKSKTDSNGEEVWEFTGKYWECKKIPGFANMSFEQLW